MGELVLSRVLGWAEAATVAVSQLPPGPRPTVPMVLGQVEHESAGKSGVVNESSGARGLLQVLRIGWKQYCSEPVGALHPVAWQELADETRPVAQLRVGAALLSTSYRWAQSLDRAAGQDWGWAVAVYGWGIGHVRADVARVTAIVRRPPTLDEMHEHLPDAGGGHVRPYWRGLRAADDADRYAAALADEPASRRNKIAGYALAPALAMLLAAGLLAALWIGVAS